MIRLINVYGNLRIRRRLFRSINPLDSDNDTRFFPEFLWRNSRFGFELLRKTLIFKTVKISYIDYCQGRIVQQTLAFFYNETGVENSTTVIIMRLYYYP